MSFQPIADFKEHISDNIIEPQDFVCIFDEITKIPSIKSKPTKPKPQKKKISAKKARRLRQRRIRAMIRILAVAMGLGISYLIFFLWTNYRETSRLRDQMDSLRQLKQTSVASIPAELPASTEPIESIEAVSQNSETYYLITKPEILPEYQALHNLNDDMVGWLTINDTIVDYPVMQTKDNEDYYLHKDFYRINAKNGCLLVDDESNVGTATKNTNYIFQTDDGTICEPPTTNIIIHGHTMSSGDMFGNLKLYKDEDYGMAHSIICFDTLYEHREYELISVFYSQVYRQSDNTFKYYKFFQANTQAEFDDWYNNIKMHSLYDTGATAMYGDQFITLSCCAYQTSNGRFVVIGKRIL